MNCSLARRFAPTDRVAVQAALVVSGALLTVLGAFIRIPFGPVPITLQTFAVMLAGLTLGRKLGGLSQLLYGAVGVAGAPIFAGGTLGMTTLLGPTGGYIASFVVVATFLGWCADKGWDRNVFTLAGCMAVGSAMNLGMGWLWLSRFLGPSAAFHAGVQPFVAIEIAKGIVVACLLPATWKLIGKAKQATE